MNNIQSDRKVVWISVTAISFRTSPLKNVNKLFIVIEASVHYIFQIFGMLELF